MGWKLLVAGHVTIDRVTSRKRELYTGPGGPPLYAGLTARKLGLDVQVLTRFGKDFPVEASRGLVKTEGYESRAPTTRFRIDVGEEGRKLWLEARCEEIVRNPEGTFDAAIVSPVAREISVELARKLSKASELTYLDPQGFVRTWRSSGEVYVARVSDRLLETATAVKMDREESLAVTGYESMWEAARTAIRRGTRYVILTRGALTRLYTRDSALEIVTGKIVFSDGVGLGDLFAAGFVKGLVEGDTRRALATGVAAAISRPGMTGLGKVPSSKEVEELASRLEEKIRRVG